MQNSSSKKYDQIFFYLLKFISFTIVILLIFIIYKLFNASQAAIQTFGIQFIINSDWNPVEDQFGALPFIYGTILTSILALLVAAPASLLVSIFICFYLNKKFKRIVSIFIEILASIPSIVYGLWGIFILVPFVKNQIAPLFMTSFPSWSLFQGPSFGLGIMTASLILSIMIFPTMTSIMRSIFEICPQHLKEASLALGATKSEMLFMSVIKSSKSGIISAIVLGLARAVGETMAVTMVIGNSPQISTSLFAPAATLASVMANEYTDANNSLHLAALSYMALILFALTLIFNLLAKTMTYDFKFWDKNKNG